MKKNVENNKTKIKVLLELSLNENYLSTEDHKVLSGLADEISAMLWQSLKNLEKYK